MRCIFFLFTSLPPASPRSIAPSCLLAPFCDFFEAHWIQFGLALYSWMCSPSSRAWSTYTLKENWLSSWRLSITNSISTSGFMVSPPSRLRFHRLELAPALCMLSLLLRVHLHNSRAVSRRTVFLQSCKASDFFTLSSPEPPEERRWSRCPSQG